RFDAALQAELGADPKILGEIVDMLYRYIEGMTWERFAKKFPEGRETMMYETSQRGSALQNFFSQSC
ncbi:MAG: hypothetical protein ACKPCP_36090, partial [Sphaerospermopsis kisseleviana]